MGRCGNHSFSWRLMLSKQVELFLSKGGLPVVKVPVPLLEDWSISLTGRDPGWVVVRRMCSLAQ